MPQHVVASPVGAIAATGASPPPAATPGPNNDMFMGIAAMVLFTIIAPGIDVLAKIATQSIPPAEISIARFVAQLLALLPIVLWRGELKRLSPRILALHALRGTAVATATICFISALRVMPVADATAIFFVGPLFLTLLGGLVLGEPVGWRRYTACIVGFAGALLVIQPSFGTLGAAALLPVGAAMAFTVYVLPTRKLASSQTVFSMQAFAGLFGMAFVAIVLWLGEGTGSRVFDPVWPDRAGWALLATIGVLTTISHLFLVYAFSRANASLLAPLQYLEIVAATGFGYMAFGNLPDLIKTVGIAVIVGSGVYIIWRERVVARRAQAARRRAR